MAAAELEQELAALDVGGIAEAWMPVFEFERLRICRRNHRLRVDLHAVFNDGRGVLHGALSPLH
jgi:hypothetical protein